MPQSLSESETSHPLIFKYRNRELPITPDALNDPKLTRPVLRALLKLGTERGLGKPHQIPKVVAVLLGGYEFGHSRVHNVADTTIAELMSKSDLELLQDYRYLTNSTLNLFRQSTALLRERFTEDQLRPTQN